MERDFVRQPMVCHICISTHTLTWSVTTALAANVEASRISTHTLTWSVTCKLIECVHFSVISTHTLTWSVTFPCNSHRIIFAISTHTLTWSVTQKPIYAVNSLNDFNSHAHVERDPKLLNTAASSRDFNSHAHVERDPPVFQNGERTVQFQLTRSRGA
mgnify:CR=1 FL=1